VNAENHQVVIQGSNFNYPNVSLGEYTSFLTPVSFDGDFQVVVELPLNIPDGDYKLTVSQGIQGFDLDVYDLTIGAAEELARIAADEALQDALDDEIAARVTGDNSEAAARTAGDAALQGALNTEVAERTAGDAALQGALNTEVAARTAGDATLQGALNTEVAARSTGDVSLQQALNAEAVVRVADDNTEESERKAADQALQAALDARTVTLVDAIAEVAQAASEEAQSTVAEEKLSREQAIEETQTKVEEERIRRKQSIADEILARTAAIAEAEQQADEKAQAKVAEEAGLREAGDNSLKELIDNIPAGPKGEPGPEGPPGTPGTASIDESRLLELETTVSDLKLELCGLYELTGTSPLPLLCFNCGNNVVEPSEDCDDGNAVSGDGCSEECLIE